jgi:hypothetical protein
MRALRLRYVAIGLLTYVQSIGIVVSASASSSSSRSSAAADNSRPSSVSTATAPCRGAGQQADREFSDIPSRTVQAPVAFVGRAKKYRLEAVANGGQDESFSRFRVQFSVVDTYKGQPVLSALSNRQSNDNSSELIVYVDIVVASSQIRRPADGAPTATCSPVSVGSRYVVFASPPPAEARTSSPVRRRSKSKKSSPLVLEAIGLPEPFSERTSKVVKEYSCPKCGEFR